MTTRAAAHTVKVLTAPSLKFARALADYTYNVSYQQMDFPVCEAARMAEEDRRQPEYAAALYAELDAARATGDMEMIGEVEKEIRKGIWYFSPGVCYCAKCAPINAPVAPEVEYVSHYEVMGERGADW